MVHFPAKLRADVSSPFPCETTSRLVHFPAELRASWSISLVIYEQSWSFSLQNYEQSWSFSVQNYEQGVQARSSQAVFSGYKHTVKKQTYHNTLFNAFYHPSKDSFPLNFPFKIKDKSFVRKKYILIKFKS